MENKVAQTLARAFVGLGYVVARFNFRGVGESVAVGEAGMPTAGMCTDGSDATRRHVLRRRLSLEGRAASALQHWTAQR